MILRWRALRQRGVLGMNDRNARFVLPLNPRANYPRVDDKVITKRLAQAAGIPIAGLHGVIAHYHELKDLPGLLAPLDHFVLKPAHGAQGNGIVVITHAEPGHYVRSNGRILSDADIRQHVSSILSGVFSLRGDFDTCIVEELLVVHADFAPIAHRGVPDVRVIVCRGLPVMAMCRLPTDESSGRANLHQGAIAVGIELSSGRAVHAIHHSHSIERHVDTGHPLVGFAVPRWDEVMSLAARASDISGLGYLGVDVVVDAHHGPLLLELNARPGLAIQLANNEGLLPRLLQAARVTDAPLLSWEQRCELSRKLFGRKVAAA
ncbi:MAG TPA: alpha-L-glutamate ligase-like protein [Terriglobales bacterium]|nr:alpha-L-glutamate ligase-like protein [Terriglobales bacterium]